MIGIDILIPFGKRWAWRPGDQIRPWSGDGGERSISRAPPSLVNRSDDGLVNAVERCYGRLIPHPRRRGQYTGNMDAEIKNSRRIAKEIPDRSVERSRCTLFFGRPRVVRRAIYARGSPPMARK